MRNEEKLPSYLCTKCADELSQDKIRNEDTLGVTFHGGTCPRCKNPGSLATPEDFGLIIRRHTEDWD